MTKGGREGGREGRRLWSWSRDLSRHWSRDLAATGHSSIGQGTGTGKGYSAVTSHSSTGHGTGTGRDFSAVTGHGKGARSRDRSRHPVRQVPRSPALFAHARPLSSLSPSLAASPGFVRARALPLRRPPSLPAPPPPCNISCASTASERAVTSHGGNGTWSRYWSRRSGDSKPLITPVRARTATVSVSRPSRPRAQAQARPPPPGVSLPPSDPPDPPPLHPC